MLTPIEQGFVNAPSERMIYIFQSPISEQPGALIDSSPLVEDITKLEGHGEGNTHVIEYDMELPSKSVAVGVVIVPP